MADSVRHTHDAHAPKMPIAAAVLGAAGVIPFAGLALVVLFGGLGPLGRDDAIHALVAYGAVILSFLGGIRWGGSLWLKDEGRQARVLTASVVPSLAGWVALLLPQGWALTLLLVGFVAQGTWDASGRGWEGRLPGWFRDLRVRLTLAVTAILAAMLYAIGLGA